MRVKEERREAEERSKLSPGEYLLTLMMRFSV